MGKGVGLYIVFYSFVCVCVNQCVSVCVTNEWPNK